MWVRQILHSALKDLAYSEIGPDLGNLVKYVLFFGTMSEGKNR